MSDTYLSPGVYIEETSYRSPSSTLPSDRSTAFIGLAPKGPLGEPVLIKSFQGFTSSFGTLDISYPLSYSVRDFFANGGKTLYVVRIEAVEGTPVSASNYLGDRGPETGLFALEKVPGLSVLYLAPPSFDLDVPSEAVSAAIIYCERKRAFVILDSPFGWKTKRDAVEGIQSLPYPRSDHAAMYFPRLAVDQSGPAESPQTFPTGGLVAGIYAATDLRQGVWKSPAGLSAKIAGYAGLSLNLTDLENGDLNRLALNCLRKERKDLVVWGARTLAGTDANQSEYKYIGVRRLALYLENHLEEALKWVVFEPNAPLLWSKVREEVSNFLEDQFRKGALMGRSPKEAYFVRCDTSTMTQQEIDGGILVVQVGFAPLKPAEFLVIWIRIMTANAFN